MTPLLVGIECDARSEGGWTGEWVDRLGGTAVSRTVGVLVGVFAHLPVAKPSALFHVALLVGSTLDLEAGVGHGIFRHGDVASRWCERSVRALVDEVACPVLAASMSLFGLALLCAAARDGVAGLVGSSGMHEAAVRCPAGAKLSYPFAQDSCSPVVSSSSSRGRTWLPSVDVLHRLSAICFGAGRCDDLGIVAESAGLAAEALVPISHQSTCDLLVRRASWLGCLSWWSGSGGKEGVVLRNILARRYAVEAWFNIGHARSHVLAANVNFWVRDASSWIERLLEVRGCERHNRRRLGDCDRRNV